MLLPLTILIISIIGFYLYSRNKTHKEPERRSYIRKGHAKTVSSPAKNDEFHCVEAHPNAHSCDAIKNLHGKRFLSAQAPRLPIVGCNKAQCNCDYIHHNDRRFETRRSGMGIQHVIYGQNGEVEHRTGRSHGRRKNEI